MIKGVHNVLHPGRKRFEPSFTVLSSHPSMPEGWMIIALPPADLPPDRGRARSWARNVLLPIYYKKRFQAGVESGSRRTSSMRDGDCRRHLQ